MTVPEPRVTVYSTFIYNFGFAAAEMMKSSSFAIFFHGLVVLLKVGFECINVK